MAKIGGMGRRGLCFLEGVLFPNPKTLPYVPNGYGCVLGLSPMGASKRDKWTCRRPNPTLARHVLLYYGVLAEAGVNEELANWKQS